jgi:hypothetical protein
MALEMSRSGRWSCAALLVAVELLLCLQIATSDAPFFSVDGNIAVQPASSDAPRSLADASSAPCDRNVEQLGNASAVGASPGNHSLNANMSLHISYLQKQLSRSVIFPENNPRQGRHLNALQDYVYVQDTPEADALAGDALDASIGGDIYSLGANEVISFGNLVLLHLIILNSHKFAV